MFLCKIICSFYKAVEAVARYIESQNQKVYAERGVILGDPMDRGLRCVSLTFYFTLFCSLTFVLDRSYY